MNKQYSIMHTDLLRLLKLVGHRGRIKPNNNESQKSTNNRPKTGNPNPTATNGPAARVLIVSKVADSDLVLLLDVGEERTLVVDAEREDTVLIGGHKLGAEHGARFGSAGRLEGQAVERREHGELELELVFAGNLEGNPLVEDVLGDFNIVDL
jgi:hypothetical protein